MGDRAILLEVDTLDEVIALHARLEASRVDGIVDLVPAARTVLVRVDPRVLPLAGARAWAQAQSGGDAAQRAPGSLVELDIAYDGPDLVETAEILGLTVDELVRRHSTADWTVAFTGFAPGFGYLVSDDWLFDVPRLPAPRTRVPQGAVGLAAGFTGAYPRETPGGWRLIGTTAARLFDAEAAAPALLAPGARVRFRPVHRGVACHRLRATRCRRRGAGHPDPRTGAAHDAPRPRPPGRGGPRRRRVGSA